MCVWGGGGEEGGGVESQSIRYKIIVVSLTPANNSPIKDLALQAPKKSRVTFPALMSVYIHKLFPDLPSELTASVFFFFFFFFFTFPTESSDIDSASNTCPYGET